MSDLLGDALTRWRWNRDTAADRDLIGNAAHNWHALTTNPNYEAGRKVLWDLSHDRYTDDQLQAVVDALTDTEDNDE